MLNGSNSVMTHVEDALSSMLSKGLSLDKQLLAASKKILLQKIEFQPAQRTSSLFPLQKLRAKYTPLNASDSDDRQKTGLTTCCFLWIFFAKLLLSLLSEVFVYNTHSTQTHRTVTSQVKSFMPFFYITLRVTRDNLL